MKMKPWKKKLLIVGIVLAVLIVFVLVTQLTGLRRYITPDLLVLFGTLLLALAALAGLVFLVRHDVHQFRKENEAMRGRLRADIKTIRNWRKK